MSSNNRSNYQKVIRRRVLAGIAWLDDVTVDPATDNPFYLVEEDGAGYNRPWTERVDLDIFDIQDGRLCVLGQLYDYRVRETWGNTGYLWVVAQDTAPRLHLLGFSLDWELGDRYEIDDHQVAEILQATWERELRKITINAVH